jgi:hypothetical protein
MARYMTRREVGRKRAWWRALSGLADFFASIGSIVVIALCVTLITTLFTWLRADIAQTLSTLESVAVSAIVQPQSMSGK